MNKLFFYDTETSGMVDWKHPSGGDQQPHIVQVAGRLVDADSRKLIASMDVIIKPDGWESDKEALAVHGITQEHALDVGIPEALAVEVLLALSMGDDTLRVAFNKTFDQRIIRIALKRFFTDEEIEAWADKDSHYCTMIKSKPILALPPRGRFGWKNPKLEEAYGFFTRMPMQDAHTAMGDTIACEAVYWGIQDFIDTDDAEATEGIPPTAEATSSASGENF